MTGHPEPGERNTQHETFKKMLQHFAVLKCVSEKSIAPYMLLLAHLESLPLDLPRSGDGLGLDEEGTWVDQLYAL